MVRLDVSRRHLDLVLVTAVFVLAVPLLLVTRMAGPGEMSVRSRFYMQTGAGFALLVLAAYLLKHDYLAGVVCHLWFATLVVLLVVPHRLFVDLPVFGLVWSTLGVMWLTVALLSDRVPLLSSSSQRYPDVALEEGWELASGLYRFYARHQESLFGVQPHGIRSEGGGGHGAPSFPALTGSATVANPNAPLSHFWAPSQLAARVFGFDSTNATPGTASTESWSSSHPRHGDSSPSPGLASQMH